MLRVHQATSFPIPRLWSLPALLCHSAFEKKERRSLLVAPVRNFPLNHSTYRLQKHNLSLVSVNILVRKLGTFPAASTTTSLFFISSWPINFSKFAHAVEFFFVLIFMSLTLEYPKATRTLQCYLLSFHKTLVETFHEGCVQRNHTFDESYGHLQWFFVNFLRCISQASPLAAVLQI